MRLNPAPLFAGFVFAVFALFGASCSSESKKERLLEAADRHFKADDYEKAEVEYMNLLKLEPGNATATARLGLIYFAQGRTGRAMAYITRGRELSPDNLELRIKLGQFHLASGKLAEARTEAAFVLEKRPDDPDAPGLLAATAAKPDEIAAVRQQLRQLPGNLANTAPVLTALAGLDFRSNRVADGEALLNRAREADPNFPHTYVALSALYASRRNLAQADEALARAASASPRRSPLKVQYGQFKVRSGDIAAGKKYLSDVAAQSPDFIPAWLALAEVALLENQPEESAAALEKALARDPQNPQALILQGRTYNARGDFEKATALLEKLATSYPRIGAIHLELGRAYGMRGDLNKALNSFNQAVALSPDSAEATFLLAQTHLRKGDANNAIALLRNLVAQRPDVPRAKLLLADAYRTQNNPEGAMALYQELEKQAPQNSQTPVLRGLILAQQGKGAEAREAFERAFSLNPQSIAPLEQLVDLDIREKRFKEALERLKRESERNPAMDGNIQLLSAKVHLAQNNTAAAEGNLRKAIELMPDSPTAYFLLAGIYSRTNRQEEALEQLSAILKQNPNQPTALMLASVIHDQRGNYKAAQEGYEKLLTVNPRSAIALNNLAYLFSERLNDLDKAQDLAQKARQVAPNDANTADTLGWILYKKRQYPRATTLLEEAAEKMPADGEIQYHLAMASYMMGDEGSAKIALERALQLNPAASWVPAATQALEVVKLDQASISASAKPVLDRILAERPDDPIALLRLAALSERNGQKEEAIATLEKSLKANPQNVGALMSLARLEGENGRSEKALELAKTARKLAPDDPDVAQSLGRLAQQNGDHLWALSLLQEAFRKKADSPDLALDLANAYFNIGRISDARDQAQKALDLASPTQLFPRQEEARRLLRLSEFAQSPEEAVKGASFVEQTLRADANSIPALFVQGLIHENRKEAGAARETYQRTLTISPAFVAAKRRLALLGTSATSFDAKTFEWALQARQAFPSDPSVARVLALQNFFKGDYPRTVSLLNEYVSSTRNDAEAYFYLGMAQQRTRNGGGTKSLQRALELGLSGPLAEETRKTLSTPDKASP